MERTKLPEPKDTRPVWLKIGGGSMRINKRIIKPGQKFKAYESEIPAAFRDLVLLQDGVTATEAVPGKIGAIAGKAHMVKPSTPLVFTKEPSLENPVLFDVKNRRGKIMNQTPLTEEEANKLISELQ